MVIYDYLRNYSSGDTDENHRQLGQATVQLRFHSGVYQTFGICCLFNDAVAKWDYTVSNV
jgi:hypothetical protein